MPNDLIAPELSRLAVIKEKSLMLWKLPEFVTVFVAVMVNLFPLKISPTLVRFLLPIFRSVLEES